MTHVQKAISTAESLKITRELTPFLVGYAFVLAFTYLFTYWMAGFGINVFEYLSVSDVLIYSAPSLLAVLCVTPYGFWIGQVINDFNEARKRREFLWPCVQLLFSIFPMVWVAFQIRDVYRIVFYLGFIVLVFNALSQRGVLSAEIPNKIARNIVLVMLIALPCIAVERGIKDQENVTSGRVCKYVEAERMSDATPYSPNEKLHYIGKAGDYFFLLREDGKSIVVTQLSSFKSLELHPSEPPFLNLLRQKDMKPSP
jgi:hypothetical protein